MMKQSAFVIKTKSKDPTYLPLRGISKAANNAVGRAKDLKLLHTFAVAGLIWNIEFLCDDAIEPAGHVEEPFLCLLDIGRHWRQMDLRIALQKARRRKTPALFGVSQRTVDKRVPPIIDEKIEDHKLRWVFREQAA